MSNDITWSDLNRAARTALINQGYAVTRASGHGGANVWMLSKDGKAIRASVRTTRDRWFAFVPQNQGSRFKTLDQVDAVVVATIDDPKRPQRFEVFLFPADEVRSRFVAAYAARSQANHNLPDDRGMWISLDRRDGDSPSNVGSGIIEHFPAIASMAVGDADAPLSGSTPASASAGAASTSVSAPAASALPVDGETIGSVIAAARQRIASIAGVGIEAVRIDLKIEY